jgi:hypothetical protein
MNDHAPEPGIAEVVVVAGRVFMPRGPLDGGLSGDAFQNALLLWLRGRARYRPATAPRTP